MNLYIFRHASTYFSKNDISYGDQIENAEILPEGIPAAKKLAEYLKNIPTDANFSSPFRRCLQTVEIVKEITGKNFVIDERLKDYDFLKENVDEMVSRVKDFNNFLAGTNYGSVAICTHGYPINALINLTIKGNVVPSDLENYPDTGILVVIKDKKVEYLNFN